MDKPAFPTPDPSHIWSITGPGLTTREYFAAHAPDVPEWFADPVPQPIFPAPLTADGFQRDEYDALSRWLSQNKFDLPIAVQSKAAIDFVATRRAYAKAAAIWNKETHERRFFAWRRHFADMMTLGLGQPER